MSEKEKLSLCPFCGGEAVSFLNTHTGLWLVMCWKCHAKTDTFIFEEKAIAAWNTRTNKIEVGNGENYEVTHNG